MTKKEIRNHCLAYGRIDELDVVRFSRDGQVILRHVWNEEAEDGRVIVPVMAAAQRATQRLADRTGRTVGLYERTGGCAVRLDQRTPL